MQAGIVILAAGASTRMGTPKQLLPYGGRPLIRHAVETAIASGAPAVVVVLGAAADRIRPAMAGLPVDVVENPRWEEGMGTSIQAGVGAAERLGWPALILTLADQPRVDQLRLAELARRQAESGQPIVAAEYAGTVGVPALFARSHYAHLLALAPGQGCKGVILAHGAEVLRVSCPEAEFDLDTPEDYAALNPGRSAE